MLRLKEIRKGKENQGCQVEKRAQRPAENGEIPAAMMELEARGVEVMHRFYSRETKAGKEIAAKGRLTLRFLFA